MGTQIFTDTYGYLLLKNLSRVLYKLYREFIHSVINHRGKFQISLARYNILIICTTYV
jgi:hypothetical protein